MKITRGPSSDSGPCGLLVVYEGNPVMLDAIRTPERGIKYEGNFWPDEFLRRIGRDTYVLASSCTVPADGDMTHGGGYDALVSASQLEFEATWQQYDKARRRLNFESLWERGGDVGALFRNILFALILVVNVFTAIMALRVGGSASDLARQVSDLRAVVYAAPGAAPPAVLTPTLGPPTGDRRPTPTQQSRP